MLHGKLTIHGLPFGVTDWFASQFQQTEKKKNVMRSRNECLARPRTKSILVSLGNPDAFRQECVWNTSHPGRSSDLNELPRVNGA